MPDHQKMREHPRLQRFGDRLTEPKLWHLNRRSVAGGLALGLFTGFLPILGQMFVTVLLAILLRVNLPIAVVTSWFSNPITFAPIFYCAYKLGAFILDIPTGEHRFELTWEWFQHDFLLIWQPLLLGSLICGIVSALLAIFLVRLFWRLAVIRSWLKRRKSNAKS